jgi:transposase
MPIDKTQRTLTPEQQIKALKVQLKQAQEKAPGCLGPSSTCCVKLQGARRKKKLSGKSSHKTSSRG